MTARPAEATRDAGIAAVVGAVLLMATLLAFITLVKVQWVPVWEADAAATRSLEVTQQLERLAAQMERATTGDPTPPTAVPLPLGPGAAVLPGSEPSATAALRFTPKTAGVTIEAPQIRFLRVNGTETAIASNGWVPFPGLVTYDSVGDVHQLRIRLQQVAEVVMNRSVTFTVLDPAGAFAGSLVVRVGWAPGQLTVLKETRGATNEVVSSTVQVHANTTVLSPYHIDALEPGVAFDQVLAAAPSPRTITVSYDPGLQADYALTYVLVDSEGRGAPMGSSGVERTDYRGFFEGGALTYGVHSSYYPTQFTSIENGAVLLDQPEGVVFAAPPLVEFVPVGEVTKVTMLVPSLEGESMELSGDLVATVRTSVVRTTTFDAVAPQVEITVRTGAPQAWADHLARALQAAGLSDTGAQPGYQVVVAPGSTTLRLFGTDANPASAANDISLELRQADIHLHVST